MGNANFTGDFKRDAIVRITECDDPYAEVVVWP